MLNKIDIIGRVGKIKSNENNTFFSVATDQGWGDKKKTLWHNVVVFKQLHEICTKYLSVGMLVYVSGELTTFESKDGKTVYQVAAREVKFLTKKTDTEKQSDTFQKQQKSTEEDFDDIPF